MNILITGSSSGIGKAAALKFLKEGHLVCGLDWDEKTIDDINYFHICEDIRAVYSHNFYNTFKNRMPEHFENFFGNIDILINSAGEQDGGCDIQINLIGLIEFTEFIVEHNKNLKAIVNIGSASAHTGSEFPEYVASKGGVLSYTKNLALRLADKGCVCNSLDFGGVLTPLNDPVTKDPDKWNQIMELTPLKKWMTATEAAEWIYFISVINTFCTGQNILIDGLEAGNAKFIW